MAGFNVDALTGILYGVLIFVIGIGATLQNVKNTKGAKERAFVIRSNLLAWIVIAVFFSLISLVPHPINYFVVVLYFALFPFVVYRFCTRRLLIRRLEEMHAAAGNKA